MGAPGWGESRAAPRMAARRKRRSGKLAGWCGEWARLGRESRAAPRMAGRPKRRSGKACPGGAVNRRPGVAGAGAVPRMAGRPKRGSGSLPGRCGESAPRVVREPGCSAARPPRSRPAGIPRGPGQGSSTRPPRRIVPPATAISRPPVHRAAELARTIHRMAFGLDSAVPGLDRWRQAAVPAGGQVGRPPAPPEIPGGCR